MMEIEQECVICCTLCRRCGNKITLDMPFNYYPSHLIEYFSSKRGETALQIFVEFTENDFCKLTLDKVQEINFLAHDFIVVGGNAFVTYTFQISREF